MNEEAPTEEKKRKSFFKRFWWIFVLFTILLLLSISGLLFTIYKSKQGKKVTIEGVPEDVVQTTVTWRQVDNGTWVPSSTPPACPDTIDLPVDVSHATSVLYPGQYRGGEYKPHGGFRFDNNKTNDEKIVAPFDAALFRGARYMAHGDVQYVFDFISPCGYMYRLGHLYTLSPKLQQIADKLPLNGDGDSRDTAINPNVEFKKGEVLATATGMTWGSAGNVNVFVDWGVYDVKVKNSASKDSAWLEKHNFFNDQYALCWFDLLSPADEAKVRSLPASDGQSGKQSDYCK